ncbi:hypothetical protein Goklo_016675 [Gossypium klotzschianum]|uniref:Uncharacterized protein n=1 Tax=Gossypium klotzschianum TaxID=34286 RepID=A0A7J8UFN7_9ROSI|nr:hypothetical protein [Gossypium klotzschianum]
MCYTQRWLWKISSKRVGSTKTACRLWCWVTGLIPTGYGPSLKSPGWRLTSYVFMGFFVHNVHLMLFWVLTCSEKGFKHTDVVISDGRHGGGHGHGGSYRHGRADYHRKRHRDDDHYARESSKRNSDHESRRASDHDATRPEKNPRFRESGDSDEEEEDDRKRRS